MGTKAMVVMTSLKLKAHLIIGMDVSYSKILAVMESRGLFLLTHLG